MFGSWVGKIPWRREWLLTPVFWPAEFHGLYSPWGHKEWEMTDQLSLSLCSVLARRIPRTEEPLGLGVKQDYVNKTTTFCAVSNALQPFRWQPTRPLCPWGNLQARVLEWFAMPPTTLPLLGTKTVVFIITKKQGMLRNLVKKGTWDKRMTKIL